MVICIFVFYVALVTNSPLNVSHERLLKIFSDLLETDYRGVCRNHISWPGVDVIDHNFLRFLTIFG
jgi:hypothetical protein